MGVREISKNCPNCNFNLPRVDGWRPLMLASFLGCTDVCEILIKERKPLIAYRQMEDFQIKPVEIKKPEIADINFYNEEGLNAVHIAAANGNAETAAFLIKQDNKFLSTCEYGMDYNAKQSNFGFTPLLVAAINCQVETAEKILSLHKKEMNKNLDKVANKVKLGTEHKERAKARFTRVMAVNRMSRLVAGVKNAAMVSGKNGSEGSEVGSSLGSQSECEKSGSLSNSLTNIFETIPEYPVTPVGVDEIS